MEYIYKITVKKGGHAARYAGRFLCLTLIYILFAGSSIAGNFQTQSCNQSYYDTLASRAWLEAQRKVQQAENYIFKPDSVLDYSCFDRMMNNAALETEQIFSEYHAEYCFPDSLDCAVEALVMNGAIAYLDSNFNHNFLGGNSEESRDDYDPDMHKMCQVMTNIWPIAKCIHFSPDMAVDHFYSFEEYAGLEVRTLPTECGEAPDWDTEIQNTYESEGDWRTDLTDTTASTEEEYDRFILAPTGGDPNPSECGPFIRTGVSYTLIRKSIPDGICSNPGCTPDRNQICQRSY